MATIGIKSLNPPYENPTVEKTGFLTVAWQNFFRSLFDRLFPLGIEQTAVLLNNQATAVDMTGLQFDYRKVNQAIVEYVIQRITGPTLSPTELIQTGCFAVVYKPVAGTWNIVSIGSTGPDAAGITFSITTGGQVQYTSSNMTGTANISKITYRARTLSAKVA